MKDRLQKFAAMWGDAAARYILIRTKPGTEGVTSCVIFDKVDRTGAIIEDDDLSAEIKRRMVAAGVPILDRVPDDSAQQSCGNFGPVEAVPQKQTT